MDGRPDELALNLVAEACLAVERVAGEDDLRRLEALRGDLLAVAWDCGDEAAREALLAVELIDDAARAIPLAPALAS